MVKSGGTEVADASLDIGGCIPTKGRGQIRRWKANMVT